MNSEFVLSDFLKSFFRASNIDIGTIVNIKEIRIYDNAVIKGVESLKMIYLFSLSLVIFF